MGEKVDMKDILDVVLKEKNTDEDMSEKQRFEILEKEKIDKNIYYYLEDLLKNTNIEILGKYEGKLFDLMKRGKLEGWCWQTTETAALFMPDDSIVYRGDLYFNKCKTYYHSFIQFNYEKHNYIFDPCLCLINTADLYFEIFNVNIKGQTTAKEIKEYFLNYISNPPKKESYFDDEIVSATDRFMRKFFGDDYLEQKQKEIVIHDEENPSAPMYRNGSGYKNIDVENNKVKKLTVHYYMNA